ncbi:GNAT family N-acetyltransferase [Paenibacillus xylanilyticus]|uniref:GNAT family N-acetyltransferase n=1 Tax=Paenibacillus xylanilyticus TaxID=248903 RepID=A0A7Y6C126_9BACL|nr:GNAT family N-acetyltransferase [Paenibacillus xylanilyticus]NUU77614.1 GNAT family N-acetyltransferase [Paenibacillus xylanilyticus]
MIRQAETRDAEAIESLYRELLPNNLDTKVLGERIEEIQNNPNSFLLVYEMNQKVIGTAHVHICLDALVENRPFGVVERVIVTEHVQSKGYGSELMKYIEDLCIQKNCVKVFLTSGATRIEAHHFYKKLGYDGESSKAFKKYL